jgi:hypothetical protein
MAGLPFKRVASTGGSSEFGSDTVSDFVTFWKSYTKDASSLERPPP